MTSITGGCLCGQLRYEADGPPDYAGYCCCADCRKASGSGFAPFMGYPAGRVRFTGESLRHVGMSVRGTDSVRNSCPACGGLVFGGIVGVDVEHTIYAGSLDDPAHFHPTMVIFTRDRPDWVRMPGGLAEFETMPE